MAAAPITIKLRCRSWAQLKSIYERDLARAALFLRSGKPPPLGARVRVDLSLPSDSLIVLNGAVTEHVPEGGLGGRGPGVDIALDSIPQSAMWLIESALKSAATKQESQPIPPAKTTPAPPRAAAIEDDADVADAESDLVAALREEHAALARLNPFQILDVGYEATDAEVRGAFGELTRKYHPDRFARYQSREARKHASEIFILIRDAYRKLGTEKARAQTLRMLRMDRGSPTRGTRPTSPPTSSDDDAPVRASPSFKARSPVQPPARETSPATPRAASRRPSSPPPSVAPRARRPSAPPTKIPAAENLLEAGQYDQALQLYRRAAENNPTDRGARAGVELAEGLRALAQRNRLEAAQRFESVLELDPSNERAARELAEMRRVATNERKGLLARLLGKKE